MKNLLLVETITPLGRKAVVTDFGNLCNHGYLTFSQLVPHVRIVKLVDNGGFIVQWWNDSELGFTAVRRYYSENLLDEEGAYQLAVEIIAEYSIETPETILNYHAENHPREAQ